MDSRLIHKNKYKFFTVGAIGTFMATLDGSILNVALPSIAADLDAPVNLVAWVVLAYSLTMISLLILFGAWTERKGYSFSYKFGFVFFLLGSVACAMSEHIYMLIASRVLQAVGTAMFASVGPGMISTVFPPEERGKGIGLMVMIVSAGFMTGPPLGGYILGFASWHTIFLINIPVALFGLYMTGRYFKMLTPPKEPRNIHLPAAACLSLGLVGGVFSLSLIDDYALSDVHVWGVAFVSVVFLSIYFWLEMSPNRSLIGLDIFRNRTFSASLGAQLMHFAGLSGVLILIPFYLENIKHFEPQRVGLFLVILPIMMFIGAPLSGKLSDRIGFRLLTSTGMIVMGVGLWLLSNLTVDSETWFIVTCLVVLGGGVGLFSTPNSSALMGSVSQERRATASGILATNRNIGMSVGVALSTAYFAYLQTANASLGDANLIFVESYRTVITGAIGFAIMGLVFCLIRNNRQEVDKSTEMG